MAMSALARLALACVLALPTVPAASVVALAQAHAAVERGVDCYYRADVDCALASFRAATASTDLTRADLVRLLTFRALTDRTMGDAASLEADLRALASLEPGLDLPVEAPPDVQQRWQRVRASLDRALALEVRARPRQSSIELEAIVANDVAHLVAAVRFETRLPGAEWTRARGDRVHVATPPGVALQYFAEAIGPGGAALASAGSAAAPLIATAAATPRAPPLRRQPVATARSADDGDHGGNDAVWWIAAGAGAAAVAAVVAIALLATAGQSEGTPVSGPTVLAEP